MALDPLYGSFSSLCSSAGRRGNETLLRILRQAARTLARELSERHSDEIATQPGRLLYPKRLHELEAGEPNTPDGLSLAYLELAKTRNAAAASESDTPVATLTDYVSRQISRAVVIERWLLDKLSDE